MNYEKLIDNLDWDKTDGLIPCIIQDYKTLQVLVLGYMNQESLKITTKSKLVTFYSRSKKRIWQKGEESGNKLELIEMNTDCDNDTILIHAKPHGPTCHLGTTSCFTQETAPKLGWIAQLENIIDDRFANPKEGSYTNKLQEKGLEKICQKLGEEAVETVIAAISQEAQFKDECADLLFHLILLLKYKEYSLNDIIDVLRSRHK
jgi:phosphoribosyl-AMP cyclohydrolase / phosphoribosyl-ATP pyrophosphohydrolase